MPDLPHLTFLPVENLLIHEHHDDERTRPLILRIRASGVFRNPPVVAPLQDRSDRYMVLDGANRITALREMRFPHALVQVVQPDDPGLSLQTWNHVIWELNARRFMLDLKRTPGVRLTPEQDMDAEPSLYGSCGLAIVVNCRGRSYNICCAEVDGLVKRVELLNRIVDSYKDHCRLDRTSLRDPGQLRDIYPSLCGLVIFPNFKIYDLLRLSGEGYLLPSGITRFSISPRALHVNYPLDELAADKPLEQKNEDLFKWLQDRLERKAVRYYAEATFLYDE